MGDTCAESSGRKVPGNEGRWSGDNEGCHEKKGGNGFERHGLGWSAGIGRFGLYGIFGGISSCVV